MRYRLFVLTVLLLAATVAQPGSISSCDVSVVIHDGRNIEGQTIPSQTVGITVPCMSKDDLSKLLQDVLAAQKPELRKKAIQALHDAKDVSLGLTTRLETRQLDE